MTKSEIKKSLKKGFVIRNNGYYDRGKPVNRFELCAPEKEIGTPLNTASVIGLLGIGFIKCINSVFIYNQK